MATENQNSSEEVRLQRVYYARTAAHYDAMHGEEGEGGGHNLALSLLLNFIQFYQFQSVLDVGSGTGRAPRAMAAAFPDRKILGVEPVAELREAGHKAGVDPALLVAGDATRLDFADGAFDVVCSFGVLHHIPKPEVAISEMLRVARRAIFISDSNRFAIGHPLMKRVKRVLCTTGLWKAYIGLKTGGKMYQYSEGDGISYSYSIFDNYAQIKRLSKRIHVMNLEGDGESPVYGSHGIAIFAVKASES